MLLKEDLHSNDEQAHHSSLYQNTFEFRPLHVNLPPLCVGLSGNGWVRGGAQAVVGLHPAGILLVRLGAW